MEDDIKELEVAGHLWAHMGPRKLIPDLVNSPKKLMGKSPCLIGKSTISMTIFNSKLLNYQRVSGHKCHVMSRNFLRLVFCSIMG